MNARYAASTALFLVLTLAACTESFTPQYVESLLVRPDSVHVSAGQSAVFEVVPITANGAELRDRAERVQWSVNNPEVATIDAATGGDLMVTAVAMGNARVTGSLGRGTVRADVYVQPAGLASISITPPSLDVQRGERPRVEAHLFDAQGNEISADGFRVSWAVSDTRIGFVGTPTGVTSDLLARRVGTTSVRLTVGHLATSIPLVVR